MIRKQKRLNIFLHVILCFVCQTVLIVSISQYLITPANVGAFTAPVGIMILFGRFICGSILHLSLIDEVTKGLQNFKFALNHPYLFQSYTTACYVCFMHSISVILVEIVNIEIILTSIVPTDIVYNFIALAIIAEFNDFVYQSLRSESMKKLIEAEVTEKILVIRHTSSKKCKDWELSTVIDEETEMPRPLRVKWSDRECANKCLYIVYKGLRMFYTSLYFYFLPFSAIILTCIIPIFAQFNSTN